MMVYLWNRLGSIAFLLILAIAVTVASCAGPPTPAPVPTRTEQPTPTVPPSVTPTRPPTLAPPTPTAQPTSTPSPMPTTAISSTGGIALTPPALGTRLQGPALVTALQKGGFVIYFRHAETDSSQADKSHGQTWWARCDPASMRQLSEAGRQQAQVIGAAIRRLQIPVGLVLSSPYCRTVETAQLLNVGAVLTTTDLINMFAADLVGGRDRVVSTTRKWLSTPPQAGTNTVLVSHGNVLQDAANITLAEGEAAIIVPGGAQAFSLAGRVLSGQWDTLLAAARSTSALATSQPLTPVICEPTPPDALGPFYVPNAPQRSSVGQGHVLSGIIRSSADCAPVAGAQLEFWLAGPDGQYDDNHRATVMADASGAYRFESNLPPAYGGRPAHIHIRATARGYQALVTQYYPMPGDTAGSFELVLIPANSP